MEANLKFEREKIEGLAVVGSYLIDGSRRLGIAIEAECGRMGLCDSCAVKITKGGEFLSAPTKAETEQLPEQRRKAGERLACQSKIEKSGEIVIMTTEKKQAEKPESEQKREEFRKKFDDLPLEKKIAQLLELEAVTLGETLAFVVNSPYHIVDKLMGVLAEFGFKLDRQAKDAARPAEHRTEPETEPETDQKKTTPPKGTTKKAAGKTVPKKDNT